MLDKYLSAEIMYNCDVLDIKKGQIQLNLIQNIDSKSIISIGAVGSPSYNETVLKV